GRGQPDIDDPGGGALHRRQYQAAACKSVRLRRDMTDAKDFPVFDCDSHIVEPPAVWDEYVPARERAWVKSQFCFHTDTDLLMINGRAVPAARERSNAAEVGWARWAKSEIGAYTPGTPEWNARFGRLLGCRDADARLSDDRKSTRLNSS